MFLIFFEHFETMSNLVRMKAIKINFFRFMVLRPSLVSVIWPYWYQIDNIADVNGKIYNTFTPYQVGFVGNCGYGFTHK